MQKEKKRIINSLIFPVCITVIIWFVKIFEYLFDISFVSYGIYPLQKKGLYGILFSPFIHSDFEHLIANTFAFLLLSTAVFYFYKNIAYKVMIIIYIVGNIFVWLIGREAYHIGISGIIYGLTAFLFFSGVFLKNKTASAISFLVAFLYGSLVWGIFPGKAEISWEAHLSGFVCGILVALAFSGEIDKADIKSNYKPIYKEEFNKYSITDESYTRIKYNYNENDSDNSDKN